MPETSLLICDDSGLARKQLLRALPPDWPVRVIQAEHGERALEIIRQGGIDLMLLDLTMPVLDGYGVLAALQREKLSCDVIVVSGDVQDEAVRRVIEMGALAFIKKPAEPAIIKETLQSLGFLHRLGEGEITGQAETDNAIPFREAFGEVVNVAMGQAAARLAKVLGVFVQLPLPNVNILEVGELHMALVDAKTEKQLTAVCQGYVGGGISGEALLIFHDSDVADVAKLMHWQAGENYAPMEMMLDLSGVLIGACLSCLAGLLDIAFSQGHPQIVGQHVPVDQLIKVNQNRWRKTLAVEISYGIEGHHVHFDLLLLFTEDSIPLLQKRISYLE